MSKYGLLRLPPADIALLLAQFQIAAVTEGDLLHPSPDLVSDLYTRLLIYLDFLHEEDQGQVEFAALDQLENPDLHMDSVRIMKLNLKLKHVIASLDCSKKFTLKDLIKPDTDRTEIFLSTMLNFCIHKDAKIVLHAPIINEVNTLGDQQREWEVKISQLNAEIAEYNEAREREIPFVQDIDAKVKELHQIIGGLNNQQMSLRASIRKLKEKVGEMDEKISNAEFLLVQSVQENANLRSKIVQSPDKLQRALEEKKSAREETKNAERLAMQAFQEKTGIVEVYSKVSRKMTKHLAQMHTIQEQVNSAKSVEKEFKALKAKLSDEELLDKSLQVKMVELQAKVQQLEDLRRQTEKGRDVKCEEATKDLNNVRLEVESMRLDLEQRQSNVEAVLMEVDAVTSKTNSIRESSVHKQQELLHKCEDIIKEFHQYTNSVGALMEVEP
ncbi:probable kinetochore protein NUF2 [Momordica charantia]|uniref:Probable kinetochore protein NUF2 n=1 Tax=Momordica charantia TaxID=3673 RepID=A0A6J1DWL1_MOMCH|nr:probable kinetochore protein NUF2 [Momordica charantia]